MKKTRLSKTKTLAVALLNKTREGSLDLQPKWLPPHSSKSSFQPEQLDYRTEPHPVPEARSSLGGRGAHKIEKNMWRLQGGKERQKWGPTSPSQPGTRDQESNLIPFTTPGKTEGKKGKGSDFLATSEKEEFLNLWAGGNPGKGEQQAPPTPLWTPMPTHIPELYGQATERKTLEGNKNGKEEKSGCPKSVRIEGNIKNMKHPEEWFKDLNIYYLVASFKVTEYYALRCRHTKVTEERVKEKNGWHAQVTTPTLKNIPFMSFAETEIF